MPVGRVKDLVGQLLRFEQVAKLEQRSGVRCRFAAQVDVDKRTNRLGAVDRIFDAFVSQAEATLGHIHAQHAHQPDRRAAGTDDR
jgi:hypothetical protein